MAVKNTKDFVRINFHIRVPQVRVIDEEGGQVGVLETKEAIQLAISRGLDLIEISPNAAPPVCKIMDYGKYKYLEKKKENEARKKQTVVLIKEIKLGLKTDEHDIEVKKRHIERFLEDGNKAKVSLKFRGREITYNQHAREMLLKIADDLKDKAMVEQAPKIEGMTISMILGPLKK